MIAISCILKHNTIKVICPPSRQEQSVVYNLMMSFDVIAPTSGDFTVAVASIKQQPPSACNKTSSCYNNNKEIKLIGSGNILLIILCPFHTLSSALSFELEALKK